MTLYTGINIQFPISEEILSGRKTVETRTYPIPQKYLNIEMILIETPGKSGGFKARAKAIIIFEKCFEYKNKNEFKKDYKRHLVDADSPWFWKDKPKWGWEVKIVKIFDKDIPVKQRGIVYRSNIKI